MNSPRSVFTSIEEPSPPLSESRIPVVWQEHISLLGLPRRGLKAFKTLDESWLYQVHSYSNVSRGHTILNLNTEFELATRCFETITSLYAHDRSLRGHPIRGDRVLKACGSLHRRLKQMRLDKYLLQSVSLWSTN